ncbi:hypothetical protein [Aureimonas glaciei]|uniref:Uncharacterized protein n=1 Tax=Aureimonas glaciei TaxID=1776957 RepID=A0A917DAW0_9HYPH|nr:hypothetical protein [Aureimonas glaciei]GGD19823.1 hypothetical protein GCM10011335_23420 [Aureimonas glaciei]
MSDEIKRSVNVAVDGKPKQFSPGPVPEGTSSEVVERLRRAGAFGEKPMASQGGAGTLEMSGLNPVTSTVTADLVSGESSDYADVRSTETERETAAEADGGGEIGALGNTGEVVDLDGMTREELETHAASKGINIEGARTKSDVRAAMDAASA